MKYKFPVIKTIYDVLPAFDPKLFYKAEKDGYVVFNYHYVSPETFPEVTDEISAIRREFRGLIFDEAGNLIRRPYHKFFNVGERPETALANINVDESHFILDKLDGSMIAPFILNDIVIWGTKMGHTDVSPQVEEFVKDKPQYEKFVRQVIEDGYTPIFEWCSRQQRIVVEYEDQLVLCAMRVMKSGEYEPYTHLLGYGSTWDIPVVKFVYNDGKHLSQDFLDNVKGLSDVEGFVIRFWDGHMVKIKCDWYCQLHRVKADIEHERGVVALILNDKIDDLKPLMSAEDLVYINEFESSFIREVAKYTKEVLDISLDIRKTDMSRKEFALGKAKELTYWQTACIFKAWAEPIEDLEYTLVDEMGDILLRSTNKQSKWEDMRKTFPNLPTWNAKIYIED